MPCGARKVRLPKIRHGITIRTVVFGFVPHNPRKFTVVSLNILILGYTLSTISKSSHIAVALVLPSGPVKSTLTPILQAATFGSLNIAIDAVVFSAIASNTNCKRRASYSSEISRCRNSRAVMSSSIVMSIMDSYILYWVFNTYSRYPDPIASYGRS